MMGVLFGTVIMLSVEFFDKMAKIDNPVGAVSVHGVCGALGTVLTGVFASGISTDKGLICGGAKFFGVQALGVVSVAAYVAGIITIVFAIIKKTIGLRVSPAEEVVRLDSSVHGLLTAYSGFATVPEEPELDGNVAAVVPGDVPAAEAIPVKKVSAFSDGSQPKFTKVEIVCKRKSSIRSRLPCAA